VAACDSVRLTALHLRRNGVIDRGELRSLLEAVSGDGQPTRGQGWVVDTILDSVMESFDSGGNNTMSFDDFTLLVSLPGLVG